MEYTDKEKEAIFVERTKRLYPYIWAYYELMVANEKMTSEELADYNWQRRKDIVRYVYENSPFYKQYYDESGFHPDDLNDETDWNRVPIITKEMIRQNSDQIKVSGVFEKYGNPHFTSGSTGEPLRVYNDIRDANPAVEWRYRGWYFGRIQGELLSKEAIIGINSATNRSFPSKEEELKFLDQKRCYLPMVDCVLPVSTTHENIREALLEMQSVKPVYIQGYSAVIEEYARYFKRNNIVFDSVKTIFSAGAAVSDSMRKIIHETFACPVCNVYGSNETLTMAVECPNSKDHRMHVLSDIKHLDIVDDSLNIVPNGVIGKTVVTSFNNLAFPFVRYMLGDISTYTTDICSCSLPFPSITPIEGRCADYLTNQDGSVKSVYLIKIFELHAEAVLSYQFVQHKDSSVTVRVCPNKAYSGYDEKIKESIARFSRDYFNDSIDFRLEYVDRIELRNAKRPIVIRELQ